MSPFSRLLEPLDKSDGRGVNSSLGDNVGEIGQNDALDQDHVRISDTGVINLQVCHTSRKPTPQRTWTEESLEVLN
jgi:hypothetical protein